MEQNNNATVEMRYPGANLNNKRFANLWQSIDFPGDFDAMRLCSLMMRPFSEGVVMGTDEMYWPVETDEVTVARYVATTVFSGCRPLAQTCSTARQLTRKLPRLG